MTPENFDPVAYNRAAWDREVDQANEWTRFDLVFNPVSNVFCPDLAPVWRECFRVLRPAGVLLTGFVNPDLFIFDIEVLDTRAEFVVRHPIPFSTAELPEDERLRAYGDGPIEFSHTLTEQIGGQLARACRNFPYI